MIRCNEEGKYNLDGKPQMIYDWKLDRWVADLADTRPTIGYVRCCLEAAQQLNSNRRSIYDSM